jgi:hypothetical protein
VLSADVSRGAAEREAPFNELAAAAGLGGRERRTGDTRERARIDVGKAIAGALDRIDDVNRPLARPIRDGPCDGSWTRAGSRETAQPPVRGRRWVR